MARLISIPGSHDAANNVTQNYVNRVGAATVVGGVYFRDIASEASESTTIALGLDAVVPVTTARIALLPELVVAKSIIADNARGEFVEGDGVICDILVESTTDIAKGQLLKPVDGQAYLVTATVSTDAYYAKALQARTANDTGLIRCILYSSGRR